jgi:hypothetical protein
MATKNLPARPKAGAIVSWNDAVKAAAAKQVKAAAVLGANSAMISFRAATLSVGGVQQRNNVADMVILATMNERAYYKGAFDPDNPRTPVCYAYGEVDGGLPIAPHKESTEPQSAACKGCKHAEWASADVGRGQACRQHFKFVGIQATKSATPEELAQATIYTGRMPPTSLKAAKVYLDFLGVKDAATFAVTTQLEVRASSKSIFTVHLEPGGDLPRQWQSPVLARLDEARKIIESPYPVFEEEKPAKQPAGKKRF